MAREHYDSELRTSREGTSSLHLLPEDNPNIFSDDYAVENHNASGRSSPASQLSDDDRQPVASVDSPTPRHSLSRNVSQEDPRLSIRRSMVKPMHLRHHPQSSYPNRNQSTASRASYAQSSTQRTSSTSSRFSIPRSQSPYVGPTGPTQPYGLYPQATRASSMTSGSTVRPTERAFVGTGGPEHPYAMYSQNVAPEDEVPGLPTVGFDSSRRDFQMQRGPERADFEDIIGPDGHAEQLPPYSRYADNIAPKVAAEYADSPPSGNPSIRETLPRVISMQRSFSHRSHFEVAEPNVPQMTPRPETSSSDDDSSGSFKEKLKATGRRRICCGLQLWVIGTILGVLLLGGLLGGIVGAVVGNHHAQEEAAQASVTAEPVETVTATSWIDASPLPTGTSLPLIPLGQFNVPTNDIKLQSNSCIVDPNLARAWDCMPSGGIGITLKAQGGRKRSKYPRTSVIIDSYPLSANFSYGPQLPDLMAKEFNLMPSIDKEATGLGPALFFFTLYDKLTILPEDKITPPASEKRSDPGKRTKEGMMEERDNGMYGGGWSRGKKMIPAPGHKPWFCFWNQTALEFFVYVSQNTTEVSTGSGLSVSSDPADSSTSSTGSLSFSSTSTPIDPSNIAPSTTSTTPVPSTPEISSPTPAISSILTSTEVNNNDPTYLPDPSSWPPPANPPPPPVSGPPVRRGDHRGPPSNNNYQDYPLFVKIQEKRKPASQGNIQPYCQQMQILDNYQVVPIANSIIQITETEPDNKQQGTSSNSKRGLPSFEERRWALGETDLEQRDSGMGNMGTKCCCEWLSV